jgi:hypothetical protein
MDYPNRRAGEKQNVLQLICLSMAAQGFAVGAMTVWGILGKTSTLEEEMLSWSCWKFLLLVRYLI